MALIPEDTECEPRWIVLWMLIPLACISAVTVGLALWASMMVVGLL